MKNIRYILFVAMAAIMAACGDNDPLLIVEDYTASGTVVSASYEQVTVEVTIPCPPGYTMANLANNEYTGTFSISGNSLGDYYGGFRELRPNYDYGTSATVSIMGSQIKYRLTIKELEPGNEYTLYYAGNRYDEDPTNYGYYSDPELPRLEVMKFTTLGVSRETTLQPQVSLSCTDAHSAIVVLEFPQSINIMQGYRCLLSTKSDMSDAVPFFTDLSTSDGYGYPRGESDEYAFAIGNLLKPNTTYYFAIEGSFAVLTGSEFINYDNTTTVPVSFSTGSNDEKLFSGLDVHSNISSYDYNAEISASYYGYTNDSIRIADIYSPTTICYTDPEYTDPVTNNSLEYEHTYYPLCFFSSHIYDPDANIDAQIDVIARPETAAITIGGVKKETALKPEVSFVYTDASSSIIVLDFPQDIRIEEYTCLLSTRSDMSDAVKILNGSDLSDYYYYNSYFENDNHYALAIGGLLKPNTTYYLQISGKYRATFSDGYLRYEGTTTPVSFKTTGTDENLFSSLTASVSQDWSYNMGRIDCSFPNGFTVDDCTIGRNSYISVLCFSDPGYTTAAQNGHLSLGNYYYPLCMFRSDLSISGSSAKSTYNQIVSGQIDVIAQPEPSALLIPSDLFSY